jgi:two-component system chemotaxis response regulator CheB
MKPIRVLVVEDSITIRKYLVDVLTSSGQFEVVAEAEDGKQAMELCELLRPEVVTMDMILPKLSGVAATEYIMAYCPTPILVVSASLNRGEVFKTYAALAAGAVDVLDKPNGVEAQEEWEQKFLAAVRMASRIKVITHPRGKLQNPALPEIAAGNKIFSDIRLVAIGASTGGPAAVARILAELPPNFPIPILIVIHISDQFAFALAEWLNTQSSVPVRYAQDNEDIPPLGTPAVLLAPAGKHMIVERQKVRLVDGPERHSCRPSVDTFFDSVARDLGSASATVLLTGMGKDGASGLLNAKRAGSFTVAQDEASSIVFGMPAEAIKLGAAQRILSLDQIAETIRAFAPQSILPRGPK